jgi:hypothetical protein
MHADLSGKYVQSRVSWTSRKRRSTTSGIPSGRTANTGFR